MTDNSFDSYEFGGPEWRAAKSFSDLVSLNIRYLRGELPSTPCHCGPLDSETDDIVADLLKLCTRHNVLTTCSQPASECPPLDFYPGKVPLQRGDLDGVVAGCDIDNLEKHLVAHTDLVYDLGAVLRKDESGANGYKITTRSNADSHRSRWRSDHSGPFPAAFPVDEPDPLAAGGRDIVRLGWVPIEATAALCLPNCEEYDTSRYVLTADPTVVFFSVCDPEWGREPAACVRAFTRALEAMQSGRDGEGVAA